jgi:hypothetical protein
MTYVIGNPGLATLGYRKAQKCGGVKPVIGIPTLSL